MIYAKPTPAWGAKTQTPCRDCAERRTACQDACPRLAAWKEKREALKKKEQAYKQRLSDEVASAKRHGTKMPG